LVTEGHKKLKDFERKLEFRDEITARTFLFNLKRLQHMWCCSKVAEPRTQRLEVIDKLAHN